MKFAFIPNATGRTFELVVHDDNIPNIPLDQVGENDDTTYWYGKNDDGFVRFGTYHPSYCGGCNPYPEYLIEMHDYYFVQHFTPEHPFVKIALWVNGQRRYGFAMDMEELFRTLPSEYALAIYRDHKHDLSILTICKKWMAPRLIHDTFLLVDTFYRTDDSDYKYVEVM